MYNRGNERISHLNEGLFALDSAIRSGIPWIRFRDMVEKPWQVGEAVGIQGLPRERLPIRNASETRRKIPKRLAIKASKVLRWFGEEYRFFKDLA